MNQASTQKNHPSSSFTTGETSKRRERPKKEWLCLVPGEVLAVLLWMTCSQILRGLVQVLQQATAPEMPLRSYPWRAIWAPLAQALLYGFCPHKLSRNQAPGFFYANVWILRWIQAQTGHVPQPTWRYGRVRRKKRLSWKEWQLLLLVDVLVIALASSFAAGMLIPFGAWTGLGDSSLYVPPPLVYESLWDNRWAGQHMWIYSGVCSCYRLLHQFFKESCVTAAFVLGWRVLPVMLALNRIPLWCGDVTYFYALYNISVDGRAGQGSTMQPLLLVWEAVAVLLHGQKGRSNLVWLWHVWAWFARIVPQMAGGWVADRITERYFPDDPDES